MHNSHLENSPTLPIFCIGTYLSELMPIKNQYSSVLQTVLLQHICIKTPKEFIKNDNSYPPFLLRLVMVQPRIQQFNDD